MSSRNSERVVVLVDMDCFYVQVEERDRPAIKGRPAAVVQYNTHRGGGIIAVNYEARACGVKRGFRGSDALEACPEIQLVQVPMLRNKANLTKYRNAGKEVLDVLCQFSDVVERASIDEAYLDVTQVVDDIIKRGSYPRKTQRRNSKDDSKNDSKNDTEETNNSITSVSNLGETHSAIKNDPKCGESNIWDSNSSGSLIPRVEDLSSTWVEVPLADSENKIFDLCNEEQRRKYELETTALSDWKPEVVDPEEQDAAEAGRRQSANVESIKTDNAEEDQDLSAAVVEDVAQASVKEKTPVEKEAERVRRLSAWLASVHKSYYSLNFDDDAGDQDGVSCGIVPVNASISHSSNATSNSSDSLRLAVAARLCEEIRATVLKDTGFKCSAGIAHNKVLAKLVCGLHKPNQQTVLPADAVDELWRRTAVRKVRNLGGKLGHSLKTDFGCEIMADVSALPLSVLSSRYDDKTAKWLYELGKGRDSEAVVARQLPKSVGCSKNFLGPESLYTRAKVQEWVRTLAEELAERLVEDQKLNKRVARTLTVSYRIGSGPKDNSNYGPNTGSKSCPLPCYAPERIAAVTMALLNVCNTAKQESKWSPPLLNIGMSAGKFDDSLSSGMPSISDMFKRVEQRQRRSDADTSTASEKGGQQRQFEEGNQSRVSNENASFFSETESDSRQQVEYQKSIEELLTAEQPSRELETSTSSKNTCGSRISPCTSTSNGSKNHDDTKKLKAEAGNSFFKSFLMRKKASSGAKGMSTDNSSIASRQAKADEDSCDALTFLVNELDSSDDDLPLSDDLKTKPILRSSSPVCEDTRDSIYDVSTDDENEAPTKTSTESFGVQQTYRELETNHNDTESMKVESEEKNRSTNLDPALELGSSNNEFHAEDAVSVLELFPNLDEVDQSLLPHLPMNLRKAVKLALVRHEAEKAGRDALNKTGIARFMKKLESRDRRNYVGDTSNSTQKSCMERPKNSESSLLKYVGANTAPTDELVNSTEESTATTSDGTINIPMSLKSVKKEKKCGALNWERLPTNDHRTRGEQSVNRDLTLHQNSPDDDCFTKCEMCGARINFSEVAEHADYHVALQLQAQLQNGTCTASGSSSTSLPAANKKTKRKMSKQALPESKKNKTIDSFFNK